MIKKDECDCEVQDGIVKLKHVRIVLRPKTVAFVDDGLLTESELNVHVWQTSLIS